MPATRNKIEKNLQQIRENIAEACKRANRDSSEVSIVAVTKSVDVDAIRTLLELGLTDIGESRAQNLSNRAEQIDEFLQRHKTLDPGGINWHMIGHLQRNKVKSVLEHAQFVHSVDSLRLAEEVNTRAERMGTTANVFLQVNCSQEDQKYGVAVGASSYLAELMSTMKHLRLVGLMTMAPLVDDPEQARPTFVRCRELFEEMKHDGVGGEHFRHLSMGMTNDYHIAVEEGATVLRIGRALFE